MQTIPISLPMTLLMESQNHKKNLSTFLITLGPLKVSLPMTPLTGLVLKVISVPLQLLMRRSHELLMSKATGGLFSNTYLKAMVMGITTTPKLPALRLVYFHLLPVVFWHLVTSPPAPSSMSTTGCFLWTLVTNTGASLWTLSSYLVLVHAVYLDMFLISPPPSPKFSIYLNSYVCLNLKL